MDVDADEVKAGGRVEEKYPPPKEVDTYPGPRIDVVADEGTRSGN